MCQEKYMRKAIDLALGGAGFTAPNPLVGAVIVKEGRIIGAGFHEKYGGLHAERNALADCLARGENPKGADMYVTLTPCCHYGKTPPCTEAIIEHKIGRVIIGSADPNTAAAGESLSILQKAGVTVVTDFMKAECDRLNPVFFHCITCQTPYVIMKYAMTADGKIATASGLSKWITGETARLQVHRDRHRYTAIMAGVGTVLSDDPLLTCRAEGGKNPVRIICDTRLRTPLSAKVVNTSDEASTIIATAVTDPARCAPYLAKGCRIISVSAGPDGHIDLKELMTKLYDTGIDSILLEGGGSLNWSALSAGVVQRVQTYIAPKIFGGRTAKTPVGGTGVNTPAQAFMLKNTQITTLGEDILIESEVVPCSQES